MFQEQAEIWRGDLADPGDGWRNLNHTIKGAARGIGAMDLGNVAEVVSAIQEYLSFKP